MALLAQLAGTKGFQALGVAGTYRTRATSVKLTAGRSTEHCDPCPRPLHWHTAVIGGMLVDLEASAGNL